MSDPDDEAPAVEPTLEQRRRTMAAFAAAMTARAAADEAPSDKAEAVPEVPGLLQIPHKGGRALSHEETARFVAWRADARGFALGATYFRPPAPPLPSKRGPKSKRTPIDAAVKRRKGLYQRLVHLPALRRGTGYRVAEQIREIARELVATSPTLGGIRLVRAIGDELYRAHLPVPHDRTISKALKK